MPEASGFPLTRRKISFANGSKSWQGWRLDGKTFQKADGRRGTVRFRGGRVQFGAGLRPTRVVQGIRRTALITAPLLVSAKAWLMSLKS